ncbi:competence protein ComEA [Vibrio hangzhouensis]|uniref:Competence protein ComEA n=2 Tax=Vibrio hangzhouensis TaxID=462991 RepID=A0A1H6C576_9VIBR|nr:ComEA family DNA-binding protein [Vibrio hangzhouensis]SEG67506.1 competence protein ComEA [Vibrio hangzhouensis]
MKKLWSLGLLMLCALLPAAMTQAADANKLEGIEITVNINQADPEELAELLKGVGMEKAKDIVEYRDKHGEFKSIDELTQVKGIGSATVEKNRSRIVL